MRKGAFFPLFFFLGCLLSGAAPLPPVQDLPHPNRPDIVSASLLTPLNALLLLLLLAALAALYYFSTRKKKPKEAPPLSFEEELMRKFGSIDEKGGKELYVPLSEIVRAVLEREGVAAASVTAEELKSRVRKSGRYPVREESLLVEFIDRAELVKFARLIPDEFNKKKDISLARFIFDEYLKRKKMEEEMLKEAGKITETHKHHP